MTPRTSQWREGEEIPEKHWMYWLAKKFFFNDFGVYRGLEKKKGGVTSSRDSGGGSTAFPSHG
jgi:hypothetical protein